MRPDDESPRGSEPPEADEPSVGDPAGEHDAPPPATWAGRRRAGDDEPGADHEEEEEEAAAGLTEEFDEIERELREELRATDNDLDDDELEGEELDDEEPARDHEPEPARAEEDEALEDEADAEPEDDQPEPGGGEDAEPAPGVTVEEDTLTLADREQAQEAALAGLRARTAKHDATVPPPPSAEAPAEPGETAADLAPPTVAAGAGDADGKPPRAKRLWARFLAATLVIVISMAAATSISLLLYLTDIAEGLSDNDKLASLRDQLTQVDAGDPQTILIIGSDQRLSLKGDPGRSDTTILLRVDPEKDAIALLSIPRDLQVTIPGVGVDKFNAAYSAGGPDLTLEVVERLTGLKIAHVVNINFTGFADAVNAIGCVYVDVDRRYYIPPESGISEINLEAGYQRMCGYNALQYVRFRHDDNDLIRAARQQDFLREARQKLPPGTLVRDHDKLLDIFTEYTTSDISDGVTLLELLKTFLGVQAAPVREVHFPAELGGPEDPYVTADQGAIQAAVEQFLNAEGTPGARPGGDSPPAAEGGGEGKGGSGEGERKQKPEQQEQDFVGPEMQDSTEEGRIYANQFTKKKTKSGDPMIQFPILYPTRLVPGSFIANDSRAFVIDGGDKEKYYGYKFVASVPGVEFGNGLLSEYYGISGTDWLEAPILDNPSEERTIDGREYLLFYDGDRLRLVGYKTKNAAYWVNNTLSQSLDEGQMLSIATSLREHED